MLRTSTSALMLVLMLSTTSAAMAATKHHVRKQLSTDAHLAYGQVPRQYPTNPAFRDNGAIRIQDRDYKESVGDPAFKPW